MYKGKIRILSDKMHLVKGTPPNTPGAMAELHCTDIQMFGK